MSLTITIPGAVEATTGATAPATLTIGVGTPGATGPAGPAGAGVPAGGTAGQFLTKIDGTNYNTDWTTLPAYAPLASPAFTGNPTAPTATTGDSDTSLATTAFVQQELASGTAIAKNLEVYVRNQTGSTLAAGTIVYINGATGNRPTVTPAQANSDANSAQTFGFVKTSIANNGFGYVIVRGELENIDTSSLTEGQQLYLSPSTAGTWTTTKPSAPQHLVYVGIVVRSHPTQGTILVAIQNGYELDEIHDVAIASKADSDLLAYDSATTLWKNKSFSTLGLATQSWVGSQGYLTSSSLTGYATESWVTSQGYLTSSSLTGYAQLSGATFTGEVATPASTTSSAGFSIAPGTAPSAPANGEIWNTGSDIQVRLGGVTETLAEQSWVTTQLGSYLTTSAASTTYAAKAGATFTGLVTTVAATTTTAGLNLPHGAAPSAPVNGDVWTTTSGLFARINGGTQQYAPLGSTNTFTGTNTFSGATVSFGTSTAASTISIGTGATLTATTKAISIGTNGVSGSTTNITIGNSISGATSTTTVAGTLNATGTSLDLGNSTAAATYNFGAGATLTATTKAVNIGTNGVAGSTTNIAIGSTTGTSTTTLNGTVNATTQTAGDSTTKVATTAFVTTADNLKANLASPTFTGTPLSTTAAADTNTTQIATTAFVVGQASSSAPVVDGTATVGTSLKYARADHVHPTDTSRAPLASPSLTGTPLAPTAAVDTNTTQIATTAYVVGQGYAKLASPTFSGTPSLPTGTTAVTQTAGNNTTAVATTAFVTAAVPAFAAIADTNSPSSTTKVMSPNNSVEMLISPNYQFLYLGAGVSGTSGTGSYFGNNGGRWHDLQCANASTAGYGAWCFDTNTSSNGFVASKRGANYPAKDWSKKIWLAGRAMIGHGTVTTVDGDAQTFLRIGLGGKNSFSTGDITSAIRGITLKVPGGGAAAMILQVSNGTTVTNVTSSFTPTLRQVFDWKIYSDGAGNVTLYVNDSQVATTTAGPTGSQDYGLYWEAVDSSGTNTVSFVAATFGAKIYYAT